MSAMWDSRNGKHKEFAKKTLTPTLSRSTGRGSKSHLIDALDIEAINALHPAVSSLHVDVEDADDIHLARVIIDAAAILHFGFDEVLNLWRGADAAFADGVNQIETVNLAGSTLRRPHLAAQQHALAIQLPVSLGHIGGDAIDLVELKIAHGVDVYFHQIATAGDSAGGGGAQINISRSADDRQEQYRKEHNSPIDFLH